jgi:hypothetical protein
MSVDQIISVESGGNPYAKNPLSSATGAGQFIDSTWLSMMAKYRPDLVENLGRDQVLALRSNPDLSREMTANYARENGERLRAAGLPVTSGTTYLAHFAGPEGAIRLLQNPTGSARDIMGPKAWAANPFLEKQGIRTGADLAAWADRKMSGQPPQVQQPAQGILPQQQQGALAPVGAQASASGLLAPQPAAQGQPAQPEQDNLSAFLTPPKPLQHLQIPMARPKKAGFAFRG